MAMITPIKTIEFKKLSKRLLLASAATPFWSPLGIVFLGKDTFGVISLNHMIVTTDFFEVGKVFGTIECVNPLKLKNR
jgi:hypothetical protein